MALASPPGDEPPPAWPRVVPGMSRIVEREPTVAPGDETRAGALPAHTPSLACLFRIGARSLIELDSSHGHDIRSAARCRRDLSARWVRSFPLEGRREMSATDDHRRHAWIAYVLEEVGKDELGELALGVFTVHIGEWPEPPGESTRDHPDAPVDGLGLDDALLWARTRAARVCDQPPAPTTRRTPPERSQPSTNRSRMRCRSCRVACPAGSLSTSWPGASPSRGTFSLRPISTTVATTAGSGR